MAPPAIVGRGQIEQLKGAIEDVVEPGFLAVPASANRALGWVVAPRREHTPSTGHSPFRYA
jgi:hypothetical protein